MTLSAHPRAHHVADAGLTLQEQIAPAGFFKQFLSLQSGKLSDRYREFLFKAKAAGMAEVEQLVPHIDVPPGPSMAEQRHRDIGSDASAAALLEGYPPAAWGYYLPLSETYSTLGRKDALQPHHLLSRRRSEYRLNFIFRGLEALLPGNSLAGKSVADIACNWGGFSIEARLRGAGAVTGFDIRPQNVAKAREVAQHFNAPDIRFDEQDLFTYEVSEPFDIVLNLGLMYHISQPFEMMKKTYEMTRDVAVIDTVVHREAFSGFILGTGEMAVDHAATAIGVELHPTYRGLLDLARLVGFRDIVELHGLPPAGWDGFEKDPYGNKTRRCIVAFK